MTEREKQKEKEYISGYIDLGKGKYKDEEVELLYKIVNCPKLYDGLTRTTKRSYDYLRADRKCHRDENDTYILHVKDFLWIEHITEYHDDNGSTGSSRGEVREARKFICMYLAVFARE